MSTLTLRHYPLTLSWSARQKDEEDTNLKKAVRRVCIRINRRKIKQALRSLATRLEK